MPKPTQEVSFRTSEGLSSFKRISKNHETGDNEKRHVVGVLKKGSITMNTPTVHVVTGAYGYSGKQIARRLLDRGCTVRTLTNSPRRGCELAAPFPPRRSTSTNPQTRRVASRRLDALQHLLGPVQSPHVHVCRRIRNTRVLFDAARRAGVERIVHVSITNPSLDSPFEYFRGKAEVEEILRGRAFPMPSCARPCCSVRKTF